ncbi:ABC transporter ATP-binding protein [Bacteroides thetaiotaomicron]|uniref:ABC transporter ATP-binding protein n=1 Tax=Bacteroides thetaiotaomicron TaxID=818 RepID=UPI0039C2CBE4
MKKIVIEADKLTKKYGDFIAVNQISFQVEEGEIFGFLGANGAGKTSAIRMLCGLSMPSSGVGFVAGFNLSNNSEKIKRNIGYMSQKFSLYEDLTVLENINLFGGIYGMKKEHIKSKSNELLEDLELSNKAKVIVRDLPLGWKQKLAFSIAIFHNPQMFFLDEPTGGVDPITRRQFWELIYKASDSGITTFVTTHYMDEAEYCNRISIMLDGRIAVLDSPSNLKKRLGTNTIDGVFQTIVNNNMSNE